MMTMTDITAAAVAARESARQDSGRFGAQEHTAPEVVVAADPAAAANDAWDGREEAAAQWRKARVAWAASHLPDHVEGVRYIEQDGQLIPALYITKAGEQPWGLDLYRTQHEPTINGMVNGHSDAVELEPMYEKSGRPGWEWRPVDRPDPEYAAQGVRLANRALGNANVLFQQQGLHYLRSNMPDGVERLDLAEGPVKNAHGGYEFVPEVIGAYDRDGALVPLDMHSREMADYRVTLARIDLGFLPEDDNDAGGTTYTLTRKA